MFASKYPDNEKGDAIFSTAPQEQEPVDLQGLADRLATLLHPCAAGEELEINGFERLAFVTCTWGCAKAMFMTRALGVNRTLRDVLIYGQLVIMQTD